MNLRRSFALALALALSCFGAPAAARALGAQTAQSALGDALAALSSEQRAAAQRAPLRELLSAAGGLAAYEASAGFGFDLLETTQVLTRREPAQWSVHSRIAQRLVFDRAGRAYAWLEYASFDAARASAAPRMQRAVWNGAQAWTESGGALDASPGAAERARTRLERAQLVGALPFSLLALECAGAYEPLGAARLGAERVERWGARLARPLDWGEEGRFESLELALSGARVLRLSLLPANGRGSQLATQPAVSSAATTALAAPPAPRGALHFDRAGELACGPLVLAQRVLCWRAGEEHRTQLEFAAPTREVPPPEALRRPAAGEAHYAPPRRAASWDAPRALQQPSEAGR